MMHWQGLTKLSYEDYTPLALFNEDPAGVQVRADSPWKSAKDVTRGDPAVQEGRAQGVAARAKAASGSWLLPAWNAAAGIDPDQIQWIPSQGAAPGLLDMVAGGIDIVPCSLPEAKSLIDAGKVKSLAVMSDKRNEVFPDVPTLKEATGIDFTLGAWRGFAGPKGLPKEITDVLVQAMKNIYDGAEYKDFMAKRGFGIVYEPPAEFVAFMAKRDAFFGETMKALGLAQ